MSDRPNIGQVLLRSGLVSEEDVERALAYQAENGGYFGEALVACGILSEEEVEWGLASQFDLPYVFPEAQAVDYDAASLVAPEWALANLTIPILKTEEALTVVVDSPLRTEPVDELRDRTGLDVQLALASPSHIRALIREVYALGTAAEEEGSGQPLGLAHALEAAMEAKAPRFGISSRSGRAWVWWDDAGTIRRRLLSGDWEGELARRLDPGGGRGAPGESRAQWAARLEVAADTQTVLVHYLADESGCEYLFRPTPAEEATGPRFAPPPEGIVAEVRLLARTGKARFVVTAEPADLGHDVLPHLPEMLFDPGWRSIYVHADERRGEVEVFSRRLPADPGAWSAELEALRAFHFDVVTVDLEGGGADWADAALDLASIAFVLWTREDLGPAHSAGVRWRLHLARVADTIEWRLEPLEPNSAQRST